MRRITYGVPDATNEAHDIVSSADIQVGGKSSVGDASHIRVVADIDLLRILGCHRTFGPLVQLVPANVALATMRLLSAKRSNLSVLFHVRASFPQTKFRVSVGLRSVPHRRRR